MIRRARDARRSPPISSSADSQMSSASSRASSAESLMPAAESPVSSAESLVPSAESLVPAASSLASSADSPLSPAKSLVSSTAESLVASAESLVPSASSLVSSADSPLSPAKSLVSSTAESLVASAESLVPSAESLVSSTSSLVSSAESPMPSAKSRMSSPAKPLRSSSAISRLGARALRVPRRDVRRDLRRTIALCTLILALPACGKRAHGDEALAIVGDATKLRRDDALPATSAIFDGARVRLRGARGETVALQVLTRTHDVASRLALAAPAPARVEAFVLHWLEVTEPSTSMYGPSRGAGKYPDPLQPLADGAAPADALYDVAIARDARPGSYHGTLTVGARVIPVDLMVEPLTLTVDDDPFVWIWYRTADLAKAHHVPDTDAAILPIERRYHAMARAHGAYLAEDLPLDRFNARRDLMRGTKYWPVDPGYDQGDAVLKSGAVQWFNQFRSLAQTAFTNVLDEPHSAEDRAKARHLGTVIGKHDKLLRMTTAAPNRDFGDAIDVYCAPGSRGVHRWTYNGAPPSAGSMIIDSDGSAMRTWGWIGFRYGIELWYAWDGTYFEDRYNKGGPTDLLSNPLTFDQRKKHQRFPDWGNGDGVLFYPGAGNGNGNDGPWPSLRLKAMRRGLQDRLILRALVACGARDVAEREAKALVPRALDEGRGDAAWPVDEAAWEAARGRLYDAWRARCSAGK